MIKVHILSTCTHCNGDAYMPVAKAEDSNGHKYTRYIPARCAKEVAIEPNWVSMQDFAILLQQATCDHEHTSYQGNMHFCAGDVLDDIAKFVMTVVPILTQH